MYGGCSHIHILQSNTSHPTRAIQFTKAHIHTYCIIIKAHIHILQSNTSHPTGNTIHKGTYTHILHYNEGTYTHILQSNTSYSTGNTTLLKSLRLMCVYTHTTVEHIHTHTAVEHKLLNGQYDSAEIFAADMRLTFHNAMLFNKEEGDPIYMVG